MTAPFASTCLVMLLLACSACGDDAVMCGPGTSPVSGECRPDDGGLDGGGPRADAGDVDGAGPAPDAATGDAGDTGPGGDASTGDAGSGADGSAPRSCGDGVCDPARPSDAFSDIELCFSCPGDCSSACGTHPCSWVFFCAREGRCTDVSCVADCMPEGDDAAQRQYAALFPCIEGVCRDVCLDGRLGGECVECVCTMCPAESAACGGLACP